MEKEKYHVVVVDDSPVSIRTAKRLLNGEEIRVSGVRSGYDMMKLVENNKPDLILLDILMPEMDGFETYRRLQEFEKAEKRVPTPVIFLTGVRTKGSIERVMGLKPQGYMLKSSKREEIIRKLDAFFEKHDTKKG